MLFETPRLIVRPLEMGDARDVLEWMGDPEIARYEYWEPLGPEKVELYLSDLVSREPGSPNEWSEYALVLKETGKESGSKVTGSKGIGSKVADSKVIGSKAIGSLSVRPGECFISGDRPRREAEIGFKLNRRYQRQGYGTEAMRAMLGHCFDTGITRVFAVVDTRNSPSIALLERIGMTRERYVRRSCFVKGEWCDEYVYARYAIAR